MISIRGLAKSYAAAAPLRRTPTVDVLKGVDLEVERREIVGIVGPNGAGKTTLLEILATLVLPDAGCAAIGGHDLVADAHSVRRLVAYCPADAQTFYARLSGAQNLEFFAALHGIVGAAARERIRETLDAVGIAEAAHAPVQTYSDGMRQRLALARALVAGASVLLLDEPTKSLDPAGRTAMNRLFRRIVSVGRDVTMLLVTHSTEEARTVCDRVAVLDRGRVVRIGPPTAAMLGFG